MAWLRMIDQTILSMGMRSLNNPQKFSITVENIKLKSNQTPGRNEEETSWKLHIRDVKESDRGCYMCQVNTKPMLNQLGCVDVLVRPDILTSGTSQGEVVVKEGENATLECKATGHPQPKIFWRKEKGSILKRDRDNFEHVKELVGERLEFIKVDRKQMGAYFCIAINDVPPGISKRVYLRVHFAPSVKVNNELLSTPLGTNIKLTCDIEAYPRTINLWKRNDTVVSISSDGRFESYERQNPDEEWKTRIELEIRELQEKDFGLYQCSAKSSMGEANATVRIIEMKIVTQPTRVTSVSPKKLNRGSGNSIRMTTPKQGYSKASTPTIQKSTSVFIPERRKYIPTTTIDPRLHLAKDQNAFKRNNEMFHVNNSSNTFFNLNLTVCTFAYLFIYITSF
ncbi:lachesin-like isoform X2 [Chelonus insularis]|nr:lachesin-like isoform X2 [Chelonus insularis]